MLSTNFSIYASLFRYPSSHPISHIQNMVIVLFINYFLRLYYAEFILTHQISLTMSILKKTPFSAAKQAAMSSTSARYLFFLNEKLNIPVTNTWTWYHGSLLRFWSFFIVFPYSRDAIPISHHVRKNLFTDQPSTQSTPLTRR